MESGMITDSFKCYPTGAAGLGLRSGGSADYNGGLHGTLSVVRESERERGGGRDGKEKEREKERERGGERGGMEKRKREKTERESSSGC